MEQDGPGEDSEGFAALLEALSASDDASHQDAANELLALGSIYDVPEQPALSVYRRPATSRSASPVEEWSLTADRPLRLVLTTSIVSAKEAAEHPINILVSLPSRYPASEPPQLQLKDVYLSSFAVDDALFAAVIKTYMHERGSGLGIEWNPGDVCIYEGIEWVKSQCSEWLHEKETERAKGEAVRIASSVYTISVPTNGHEQDEKENRSPVPAAKSLPVPEISTAEPIQDRKSVFVGHAAAVNSIEDVHAVMSTLLSDKRIARATHNMMAYRFEGANGILHQDNDDDGESAAGSRMAHLLSLLDVMNVVVVVSRWYGGIHLGADRFKHINAATRNALEAGGLLVDQDKKAGRAAAKKR